MPGQTISFTVPLVPPSVNHYKVRTKRGVTYVTKEALAFKAAVAIFGRGKTLMAFKTPAELRKLKYQLVATVFLGKGQHGDGDNFWKCIADGVKEAGVIHSDAAVKKWHIDVDRDWVQPRTEITVTAV